MPDVVERPHELERFLALATEKWSWVIKDGFAKLPMLRQPGTEKQHLALLTKSVPNIGMEHVIQNMQQ